MRTPRRNKQSDSLADDLEFATELLKERIYATLVLLAVLMGIDTGHISILRAEAIVGGTAISLWAASLVATQMSRRVILQRAPQDLNEVHYQLRKHSQLLLAAVTPTFLILLAGLGAMSLRLAIDISIALLLVSMIGWSLLSARAMKASKTATLVLAGLELGIGLAVVGLKLLIEH